MDAKTNNTPAAPTQASPYMDLKEAAHYIRVSVRLVQKLVQNHKLRPARIGRRLIFQRAEIDRYVSLCMIAG